MVYNAELGKYVWNQYGKEMRDQITDELEAFSNVIIMQTMISHNGIYHSADFVAGGVGLAPLRSVINYCRDNRDKYGKIDIVYGSRSKDDLLDYEEIINEWATDTDVHVHLTIDREQEGWDGHVGFVPNYVKELGFDTNKTAVLCGPPIMIKFTLEGLCALGFDKTQIYTTLELRMKCGVGKCGRCNVGSKYVCKDGPVFRCDELEELPSEY